MSDKAIRELLAAEVASLKARLAQAEAERDTLREKVALFSALIIEAREERDTLQICLKEANNLLKQH